MIIYADSSWWLAYKHRDDAHHALAVQMLDREAESQVLWTPWHRVEVFNIFRQAEFRRLIQPGAAQEMIRKLEHEIRVGYWPHVEFSWTDAVRTACELGVEHSLHRTVRGMDLFHVAVAVEVAADAFLSFDEDQNELARATGLSVLHRKTRRK